MVPFETIFQNIIETFWGIQSRKKMGICNCADGGGKPFSASNFWLNCVSQKNLLIFYWLWFLQLWSSATLSLCHPDAKFHLFCVYQKFRWARFLQFIKVKESFKIQKYFWNFLFIFSIIRKVLIYNILFIHQHLVNSNKTKLEYLNNNK